MVRLTPEARDAVQVQQQQISFLLNFWPYFTTSMLILGLGFVLWGAISWKRQQDRANDREVAEIEKLQIENEKTYHEVLTLARAHQASPEEAEQAREDKMAEALEPSGRDSEAHDPTPPTASDQLEGQISRTDETATPSARVNPPETREDRAGTEQRQPMPKPRKTPLTRSEGLKEFGKEVVRAAMKAFTRSYGPGIDIVPEVSLGGTIWDAVIISEMNSLPNLALDVKVVGHVGNTRNRLHDSIVGALKISQAAPDELREVFTPTIFLIVDDLNAEVNEDQNKRRLSSVVRIVERETEALSGLPVPMNIVVATFNSLMYAKLHNIDWRTNSPRVVVLD
ncbi:hypothetical protein [Micromonospora sp. WMMA1996]|uniref:hypothetical protein n=1 Tax=Micromonospora sp. WMMA1996 TaxID=2039878 RepID=UPI0011460583|nr:hypothetical protein [Micromonospora sp. WMMA1996]